MLPQADSLAGRLARVQQTIRGVLTAGNRAPWTAVHWGRRVSEAVAALEKPAARLEPPGMTPRSADQLTVSVLETISGGHAAVSGAFPQLLRTGAVPVSDRVLPPAKGTQKAAAPAPQTRIIYRSPERRAEPPSQGTTGETSGEAVLQAQTVGAARAAAMNAAYSYPPGGTEKKPGLPAEELTAEQEERITQRLLEDINYNRMASEVLDRVERRLRAERRKFGR